MQGAQPGGSKHAGCPGKKIRYSFSPQKKQRGEDGFKVFAKYRAIQTLQ